MDINPGIVSAAGIDMLDASSTLRTGWQDAQPSIDSLRASAAGNSNFSSQLFAAADECAQTGGDAFADLADVLEEASDAVVTCAFEFSTKDEEIAKRMRVR